MSVQEEEIVDYESQLVGLTSRCTTACRPLQATLTSSSSGQFISALFGSYVVNRGGKTHTQKIGVATLNTTLPLDLHEHSHLAVAELLAAFYMQWHWWNERTDFTTPELIELGKAVKTSFETVQLHIAKLESSARKEVAKAIFNCLDIENVASFLRAQVFEWVSNKTQDPWKGMDWQKRYEDTLRAIQTGQSSVVDMTRFRTQMSRDESKKSLLVENPKPPTSSELTQGSARELVTYLRSVEQHQLIPMWGLLHKDFDSELAWYWNVRPEQLKVEAPSSYQAATNIQLIQWLESLYVKDTHKPKKQRFLEFIDANPLQFDPLRETNLQEGNTGRLLKKINNLWRDMHTYKGDLPTKGEEETMVKKLRKNLRMLNCQPTSKEIILNDLDRKLDSMWLERNPAPVSLWTDEREQQKLDRLKMAASMTRNSMNFTLEALLYVFHDMINDIAKVRALMGTSIFGLKSASSSFSDRPDQKKKKTEHKREIPRNSTVNPLILGPCPGCGYVLKNREGEVICPRNGGIGCDKDPRRNNSGVPWVTSTIGKAWEAKGQKCLPKDISVTLETFIPKTLVAQSNPTKRANDNKGTDLPTYSINNITTDNTNYTLNFFLYNIQEESQYSRKRNKADQCFKAAAAISHALLDSGAIGSCVISPSFYEYISTYNIIKSVDRVKYNLSAPLTNKNIILNNKYSFIIFFKSERPQQAQLVSVEIEAVVAPISYDLILDRDTIKKYNLIFHFPSHFVEGPILDKILSIELPEQQL
jgi:hypothetical protein